MTNDIHDDLMFGSLAYLSAEPNPREVKEFRKVATSSSLPQEYTFESLQAIIKVNRIKMEFRVLQRKYYSNESIKRGYPSRLDVDIDTMMAYKIAKLAGFEVFLEPKYMN